MLLEAVMMISVFDVLLVSSAKARDRRDCSFVYMARKLKPSVYKNKASQ